jgi:polar amino acid transport system permease protein
VDELFLSSNGYARLWEGTLVTLAVFASSTLLGTVLSLIFGVGRLSPRKWVRTLSSVYVEFARGISAIILLFWVFFSLPILLDIRLSPFVAATIALGANMGAYGAEVVRGGILAVPKGQTEATIALNLTDRQRLRHVVLPQAIPVILPPFGNLMIEILKGTALVYLITLSDLMFEVDKLRTNQVVIENSASTPVLFLNALVIYFLIAQVIAFVFGRLERRVVASFGGARLSSTGASH